MIGLFWTLYYTREAVRDTSEATEQMRRQNDHAEETAKKQLRAYLDIFDIDRNITRREDWDKEGNAAYRIDLPIKNFGQTPARNVTTFFQVLPMAYPVENWFFPPINSHVIYDIPPQGRHNEIIPIFISDTFARNLSEGKSALYVFACLTYEDAFGDPHRLKFTLIANQTMFIDGLMGVYRGSYEST